MRIQLVRAVMIVVLSIGVLAGSPTWGQETRQALIESFTAEIRALNGKDLAAAIAPAHEKIVLYGLYSPFPIEGKDAFRQAVQEYFEIHERAVLELVYPQYEIAGATGVAWGHYQLTTQPKGATQTISHGQYMLTYARPDGEWQIISMHFAPLPGGN